MMCHLSRNKKNIKKKNLIGLNFLIIEKVGGTPGGEDIVPFAPIESLG